MQSKSVLMIGLAIGFPVSLFAAVLTSGSVYFDSEQTYEEVKKLAAQGDNEGISKLIADRHVSRPVADDLEISVISPEQSPDGLVEFRFQSGATPYWSLAKWVKPSAAGVPGPQLVPTPNPDQAVQDLPEPTPDPESIPSHPHHVVHHAKHRMHHFWHLVNGHLYWSPVPLKTSSETSRRPE